MKVYGVRIFVDDLAAARTFYTETLGLPVTWDDTANNTAFGVNAGGAELIIERADPAADGDLVGRFVGLSLSVDDVEARHRELAAKGVTFTHAPKAESWGGMLAHFSDPAGNILTLVGPTRF